VSYSVLPAGDAHWQRGRATPVVSTDLAGQLGASTLGARIWRLVPGQALPYHRHFDEHELYVVLEGTGRMRVGGDSLELERHSAVLVEPETLRQLFNDTDADALWLVVGAPRDVWDVTPELLATVYPDGIDARPPELRDSASSSMREL
jgi:quercetin dioxygenase-like cupin family protein